MTSIVQYKDVREAALALKEDERAMLIDDLRESFSDGGDYSVSDAELDRRYREMREGKNSLALDSVFPELSDFLKRNE